MPSLTYSMGVSLDGYINDAEGAIDWGVPDDELFQFHIDEARGLGAQLLGRRLYEEMLYWETVDDTALEAPQREWAAIWRALPKIVFSHTLESVTGNSRLADAGVVEETARLKAESDRDIAVGGAGLARACTELGLIDEYRLLIRPVVLGGGTPYFPDLDRRLDVELVEHRIFGSGVVYLRYRRA